MGALEYRWMRFAHNIYQAAYERQNDYGSCLLNWIVLQIAVQSGYAIDIEYRTLSLFLYSNENSEPSHIHIQRDRMLAKFWLTPVALAGSTRFSPKELRKLESLVNENKIIFLEAWNEHFSG